MHQDGKTHPTVTDKTMLPFFLCYTNKSKLRKGKRVPSTFQKHPGSGLCLSPVSRHAKTSSPRQLQFAKRDSYLVRFPPLSSNVSWHGERETLQSQNFLAVRMHRLGFIRITEAFFHAVPTLATTLLRPANCAKVVILHYLGRIIKVLAFFLSALERKKINLPQ